MTSDTSTRRAEQVGNSLPQSYFGELLQDRELPTLVRSLFIPSVWFGTWNREGAPSTLAEWKGTDLETLAHSMPCAVTRSLTMVPPLLSSPLIYAPSRCQTTRLPTPGILPKSSLRELQHPNFLGCLENVLGN